MAGMMEDKAPLLETMPTELNVTWRSATTLDHAKNLIDLGILLTWKDQKHVQKVLTQTELEELIVYCTQTLVERVENRLPEEILIESLLVIFANAPDDSLFNLFIDELLLLENWEEACQVLVEIAITAEFSDTKHGEHIFSTSVSLICELGKKIAALQEEKGKSESAPFTQKVLDHISTYLLSVSNNNDNCIRLSLLNYFGNMEKGKSNKPGFNRVMNRFGHTVLEHLFSLLFNKKTEAMALQFLLENIPFVLDAGQQSQLILQETWKHYLLKKPERFALFLHELTQHLEHYSHENGQSVRRVYLQHLALLLKKVAEVDHKELGREILVSMTHFHQENSFEEIMRILTKDHSIRDSFRKVLAKMLDVKDGSPLLSESDLFRSSKRGRRPSFAKADKTRITNQIRFLGQQTTAKVS